MDNIVQTLKDDGYGDTPEEKCQEALDNYSDTRRGKAEAIQDYINCEEMNSLSLWNSTQTALDEKMRTSALSQASESSQTDALDCLL